MDDMGVKTKREASHLSYLEETFSNLVMFDVKLNPTKCTFGVKSGKFLEFMTSKHGIEANPEKIEVVMRLTEPRCIKDIQRIN